MHRSWARTKPCSSFNVMEILQMPVPTGRNLFSIFFPSWYYKNPQNCVTCNYGDVKRWRAAQEHWRAAPSISEDVSTSSPSFVASRTRCLSTLGFSHFSSYLVYSLSSLATSQTVKIRYRCWTSTSKIFPVWQDTVKFWAGWSVCFFYIFIFILFYFIWTDLSAQRDSA